VADVSRIRKPFRAPCRTHPPGSASHDHTFQSECPLGKKFLVSAVAGAGQIRAVAA